MSDARVNLLPDEVRKRGESNRVNGLIGVGFIVLLVLVAAGWWVLKSRVDDAKAELATEDQVVATLRADLADLNEFQQLQARVASTDGDMQVVLGGEVSLAGLLQDLAAVMPSDVELTDLSITVDLAADPTLGDQRPPIGLVAMGDGPSRATPRVSNASCSSSTSWESSTTSS